MLTDDEKYLFKPELEIEDIVRFTDQNARDIISFGFDPAKTFIFSDFDQMGGAFYKNVIRVSKHVTQSQIRGIFGFKPE